MNTKHVLILIAIVSLFMLTSPNSASAYIIPEEYHTSDYMNDVQVYQVSIAHMDIPWGYDNLRQLAVGYTNSGDLSALIIKMNWYISQAG